MVSKLFQLALISILYCPIVCLGDPWWLWLASSFLSHSFLTLVALQAMNDRLTFFKRNVKYLSNRKSFSFTKNKTKRTVTLHIFHVTNIEEDNLPVYQVLRFSLNCMCTQHSHSISVMKQIYCPLTSVSHIVVIIFSAFDVYVFAWP